MNISIGATGNLITGDVLDVGKSALQARLQDYDPQLYLKWNPRKRQGNGCWELRRRPEKKYAIYYGEHEGLHYFKIDYVEIDLENHIFDVEVLNYRLLEKVKKADIWAQADYTKGDPRRITAWIKALETEENEYRAGIAKKHRDEAVYGMKQYSTAIQQYKDAILSGVNPALLAHFWGRK